MSNTGYVGQWRTAMGLPHRAGRPSREETRLSDEWWAETQENLTNTEPLVYQLPNWESKLGAVKVDRHVGMVKQYLRKLQEAKVRAATEFQRSTKLNQINSILLGESYKPGIQGLQGHKGTFVQDLVIDLIGATKIDSGAGGKSKNHEDALCEDKTHVNYMEMTFTSDTKNGVADGAIKETLNQRRDPAVNLRKPSRGVKVVLFPKDKNEEGHSMRRSGNDERFWTIAGLDHIFHHFQVDLSTQDFMDYVSYLLKRASLEL